MYSVYKNNEKLNSIVVKRVEITQSFCNKIIIINTEKYVNLSKQLYCFKKTIRICILMTFISQK